MDLSLSPDLDSIYCYLIVLILGAVTAYQQLSTRFGSALKSAWLMASTWALALAYLAVPVVLFWFLDRTNAIHDTSVFAAVLVGAGYQQVLAGGLESVKVSGQFAALWQPFVAWADIVLKRTLERIRRNEERFKDRVISRVASDEERLTSLVKLAMTRTEQTDELKKQLDEIQAKQSDLGEEAVREQKARMLYQVVQDLAPNDFQYLLYERAVTSAGTYYWLAKEWRSKTVAVLGAVVLVAGLGFGFQAMWTPEVQMRYYVWRLQKPNTTDLDRFRCRVEVAGFLAHQSLATETYRNLAHLLKFPNLTTKTADDVLHLLIQNPAQARAAQIDLPTLLIDALRTQNNDVRTHIHRNLIHLAAAQALPLPTELSEWQPTEGDYITDLETQIQKWKDYWTAIEAAG